MKTGYLEVYPERCQAENVVSRQNSIILIRILVSIVQFERKFRRHYTTIHEYIRKDGTMQHRGKGRRLMAYVHSLIWELSSVEIACELTGSGECRSIHRDEREQSEVNVRI